jgi:hypothetical protein
MHFRKHGLSTEHVRSKAELLDEIVEVTSYHYRSAVKHCLKEDALSQAGSGTGTAPKHTRLYRKVIKPLDNHYQELRKHAERHSKVYDAFGQHTIRYATFPQVRG